MNTNRTKAKPDEQLALKLISTMSDSITSALDQLSYRLKDHPVARRGLKAAATLIENAVKAAMESITDKSINYIVRNSAGYEMIIRPRRVTPDPAWVYVSVDDLRTVMSAATAHECAICIRSSDEAGRCTLRKAMEHMTDEPETVFGCGYRAKTIA